MSDKELIERMLKYRAERNLSLEKFAKLCGITKITACNVENGRSDPSKLTKQKILNVIEEK